MQKPNALGAGVLTLIFAMFIMIATLAPSADAYTQRRHRRHNPEAG